MSAPVLQKLTASLSAQTVIKLPKKKYTPKQDVQLAHAPRRSASIRLNKTATCFQMALSWSTNCKSLILNA